MSENRIVEEHRRELVALINSNPQTRERIEEAFGQCWDTEELTEAFEVIGFSAPLVVVRRKADQALGSLMFQHHPRLYFCWEPHE